MRSYYSHIFSRFDLRKTVVFSSLLLAGVSMAAPSRAQFLDVTSLSSGTSGSFSGTLDGVAVTGAITANDGSYSFTPTGTGFGDSTINNSSPQYSYAGIYSPSQALTDRIGYTKLASGNSATVVVTFATAVTNPVFHVANLDGSQDTFSFTGGLTGLSLLSGNGGGGDGLGLIGNTVLDLNNATLVGVAPSTPPPTTGARSGYGSVQLFGTISTLTFSISSPSGNGDGGSFTFSRAPAPAVPEPGSVALLVSMGASGAGFLVRRRRNAEKAV